MSLFKRIKNPFFGIDFGFWGTVYVFYIASESLVINHKTRMSNRGFKFIDGRKKQLLDFWWKLI